MYIKLIINFLKLLLQTCHVNSPISFLNQNHIAIITVILLIITNLSKNLGIPNLLKKINVMKSSVDELGPTAGKCQELSGHLHPILMPFHLR